MYDPLAVNYDLSLRKNSQSAIMAKDCGSGMMGVKSAVSLYMGRPFEIV